MNFIKGNIFAFLGTSIFALNFISMKVLVDILPTNMIIFLRFSMAGVFLFLILLIARKNILIKNKNDFIQLIITGFLGMSLYYIFFANSLKYISASLASLICSMIPIFTLIIDTIINKSRATKTTVLLFIISTFGVYLVIDVNLNSSELTVLLKGIGLMLLALTVWIAYTIKAEYLLQKYNSLLVLAYQCIFGSVISLILVLDKFDLLIKSLNSPQMPLIVLNILFTALIATALGYLFYNLGIKNIGVTISSVYMNTMPAITLFASYFILNSALSLKKIIGVTIVVAAALTVALKES